MSIVSIRLLVNLYSPHTESLNSLLQLEANQNPLLS